MRSTAFFRLSRLNKIIRDDRVPMFSRYRYNFDLKRHRGTTIFRNNLIDPLLLWESAEIQANLMVFFIKFV